ncbi:hypothetical protein F4679DRAFT_22557 [Xylaria curta]|nr:hypothetical protein F4679DRAFT_22557 [Xylaria curta]
MSNKAFEDARKAFVATLQSNNEADFSPCSSPDDIVKTLRNFECLSKDNQKKRLPRCLTVIKKFNDRLQPYFDALNVLVGTDTNAALAYGAFRIILQLASGFPSFFEKLIAILSKLADIFPQYEDIAQIFEGDPPPRIRHHLESVYRDLFEFFHITARIFTASSGKVKRPARIIATVIWEPFDAKFGSLIERMGNHQKFVIDELQIMVARIAKSELPLIQKERQQRVEDRENARKLTNETEELKRKVDKEFRDSSIQRILDWLAPPPFAETLESSKDQRQENTALWIFENDGFKRWKESKPHLEASVKWRKLPPWVLWVNGNPGCGKTILAASVIEELLDEEYENDQPTTICYFFFKYGDYRNSSIEAACRSALAQILHRNRHDNDLLDKFVFARIDPEDSSGQSIASLKELLGLMRICSTFFGQLSLILDGIDEADEPDSVCSKLRDLVTTASIKLMCFSRGNVNCLQNWTPQSQIVSFDRLNTNSDIRLYLAHQLEVMQDDRMLPTTTSASLELLIDTLIYGADGMFLWAKLMMKYLGSPALTPRSRLDTINSVRFPEGLNVMYDRIFTLISTSRKLELDLARQILIWLHYSVSPEGGLTQRILQSAVTDFDEHCDIPGSDFVSAVVSVCGGLVEFTPQARFQLAHLTVKEYMQERAWSRVGLPMSLIPGEAAAAAKLAAVCIQYLLIHANRQTPQSFARSWSYDKVPEFRGSFQSYAMRYWGYHLSKVTPGFLSQDRQDPGEAAAAVKLLDVLNNLLGTPLALGYWIEGIYKSQAPVTVILSHIQQWSFSQILMGSTQRVSGEWVKLSQHLLSVAKEVHELDREWGAKLLIAPFLIWDDALIFLRGGVLSQIRETYGVPAITILAPEAPRSNWLTNIQCLCTISSTANDGTAVGVLSIFPSPQFEKFWKTMDTETAYHNAEHFASGWIAKYGIYSSGSKKEITSLEISIPEPEIVLLLRQSFRQKASQSALSSQDDEDDFVTSFPLAISPNCLTFSILRTVYNIQQIEPNQPFIVRSFVLPLEFLDHFNSKWTPQLSTFEPKHVVAISTMFSIPWRNWYKYSLCFSPNGKYIGFMDYQKPLSTHLAVFEVLSATNFSIRLVQWTTGFLDSARVRQMIFHPVETLVAILSERKVGIWDFLQEGTRIEFMPTQFDTCLLSYEVPSSNQAINGTTGTFCVQHNHPVADCHIQSIAFSQCGNFVVANTKKQVVVLHIPQKMLTAKTLSHSGQVPCSTALDEPKAASDSALSLLGSGIHPGSVMRGSHLLSTGTTNTPSGALRITTNDNNLGVQLVGHDVSADRELRLLSMPKSFDMRNAAIDLRIPMSSDDSLRIMFNKKAEESYKLGDNSGGQFQFPMILDRKIQSIMSVPKPGSGRRQSDEPCIEGPPRKRRAVDITYLLKDTPSQQSMGQLPFML